jgi:aspartyl-tRNA(Asn)/glutamyl-tRNA(Gln) amidotransferase subunit A
MDAQHRAPEATAAAGDDLAYLPAVDVLRLFSRRELAPSEYLSHLFHRIEADAHHPLPLNAFTELLEDEARQQARAADELYSLASGDAAPPPLTGLPVATKEKHGLQGRTLSQGMSAFRDARAEENHPVVERLQQTGAIIHARTTSPEFSCATVTHSSLWGVTRNPWNRELSPGGSSGGAAAALAGGLTPLATASDIAGSTRLPAGFCGLVGYKGPYGTVPGMGPLAADWYRGDGAMARTVGDTLLLTHVIRGKHPLDHGSVPSVDAIPTSPEQTAAADHVQDRLRGMRIAYSPTLGNYPVERGVQSAVEDAVRRLAEAGAEVVEVTLPWSTAEISRTTMAHFGHLLAGGITETLAGHEETMEAYTRRFVEVAEEHASNLSLFQTLEREHRMQAELAAAMEGCSALITPVSAIRALEADGEYPDGITVGNQPSGADRVLDHYWEAHMTVPFNVTNRCPVLSVPAGVDRGFPVGMQIVGHPFDERTVFEVGAAWELLGPALDSKNNHSHN